MWEGKLVAVLAVPLAVPLSEAGAAEEPAEARLPSERRPEARREEPPLFALGGSGRAPPGRERRLFRRSAR